MTDGGLALQVQLGERAAEWRVKEHGVVAEAVRPARRWRNLAVHNAFSLEEHAARLRQGHVADEPCGAPPRATFGAPPCAVCCFFNATCTKNNPDAHIYYNQTIQSHTALDKRARTSAGVSFSEGSELNA